MANDEPIESTATEIVEYEHAAPVALFGTTDPLEIVAKATSVADALKDVIDKKHLSVSIQGKEHVTVDGWQLLGSMLGVTAVCVSTERVENGFKATVEARTADGRVVGRADALCTKDEKRGPWKSADDYARLSMAQTRATSKALKGPLGFVVSLAGYAATPAEEMTFAEPDAQSDVPTAKPDPGPPATEQQIDTIHEEAQAHDLDPIQSLNAIREGLGLEPKTEITEQAAAEAVPRILSKLPMAHVQPVLAAIRNTVPF